MSKQKVLSTEEMITFLKGMFPQSFFKPSSEFYNDNSDGIWTVSDSNCPIMKDGLPAFNAYSIDLKNKTDRKKYELDVHKQMHRLLKKCGYYAEHHDTSTIMLWKLS